MINSVIYLKNYYVFLRGSDARDVDLRKDALVAPSAADMSHTPPARKGRPSAFAPTARRTEERRSPA